MLDMECADAQVIIQRLLSEGREFDSDEESDAYNHVANCQSDGCTSLYSDYFIRFERKGAFA